MGSPAGVPRVGAPASADPPLGQQRLDKSDAAERDSLTLQRRPDRLVILVVTQDALGLDRAQTHGMKPVGPLQPGAIRVVVFNENLFGDRIGVESRHAERGMSDRRDRFAEQATRSRRRALGAAIANGDIRALGSQIHHLVVGRRAHVDIGMALLETAKARHDPQSGDADAGGDRHRLAVAPGRERVDAILQLLQGAVGDAKETFAFGGEADRTVAAVEQLDAKRLLERDDLTADSGLGEEKILGGQRYAHAPANGDEAPNEIQRRQPNGKISHVISSCDPTRFSLSERDPSRANPRIERSSAWSRILWPHAIDTEKSFDGEPSWILSRSGKAEPARLAGVAKPEPPEFVLWAPIAQENDHAADRIAAHCVRTHVAKLRPLARGPARVASAGSGTG